MPKRVNNKIKKAKLKNSQFKDRQFLTAVYDLNGQEVEKIALPKEIFDIRINPTLISQYMRVYLANQRIGTHNAKTRAEVIGSTRKIYRQKGTGRARHGDIKAPIFIGGGVAHGPKPRDYSLKIPVKMKRKVLFSLLSEKYQDNKMKIVSGLEKSEKKTKKLLEVLNNLGLIVKKEKRQPVLLVHNEQSNNIYLAGRNISFVTTVVVSTLNAYDLIRHKNLLLTKNALISLNNIFFKNQKTTETDKGDVIQKDKNNNLKKATPVPVRKSEVRQKKEKLKQFKESGK